MEMLVVFQCTKDGYETVFGNCIYTFNHGRPTKKDIRDLEKFIEAENGWDMVVIVGLYQLGF